MPVMDMPPELKERVDELKIRESERMLECRCRNRSSCTIVNGRLGWWNGMPLEDCDLCWALGGEQSPEANQFREKYVAGLIGAMTKAAHESPKKPAREILVALTVFHNTISESRFKEPDIQNAVKSKVFWVRVKPTWEKAASLMKSLASKVPWRKSLDPTTLDERHAACFGSKLDGTVISPPCQMLKKTDAGFFCGACGCGTSELAKIKELGDTHLTGPSKLRFPHLECPLQKKGFSNARDL